MSDIDDDDPGPPELPTPPRRPLRAVARDDRQLPQDPDLEKSILGSCLYAADRVDAAIATGIVRATFMAPSRGSIWDAVVALRNENVPVDAHTVWDHLERRSPGHVVQQGDLLELVGRGGSALASIPRHAEILIRHHAARTALGELSEARTALYDEDLALAAVHLERATAAGSTAGSAGITSSWEPVDLAGVITGDTPDTSPTILHRNDGQALIYPGKIHALNAAPEAGKTWVALAACVEQLDQGDHVLYVDFEDGPASMVERLIDMHTDLTAVVERFHYLRPDDPADLTGLAHLQAALDRWQPTLTVLDGVTEAMVLNGWSISDNDDIARFYATLPRRVARTGSAVLLIDHVVKDKEESRGRHAIGGQHKLAGVDGAVYRLDAVKPFGRGLSGQSKLTVTKDRGGHIRPSAVGGEYVADIHVDAEPDGGVTIKISAPDVSSTGEPWDGPTRCMDAVAAMFTAVGAGVELSKNQVKDRLKETNRSYRNEIVGQACERLAADRRLTVKNGPRGSRMFSLAAGLTLVPDGQEGLDYDPDAGPAGM